MITCKFAQFREAQKIYQTFVACHTDIECQRSLAGKHLCYDHFRLCAGLYPCSQIYSHCRSAKTTARAEHTDHITAVFVSKGTCGWFLITNPCEQRLDAGLQLRRMCWLGQVIICPNFEADYFIIELRFGCEHQNGSFQRGRILS